MHQIIPACTSAVEFRVAREGISGRHPRSPECGDRHRARGAAWCRTEEAIAKCASIRKIAELPPSERVTRTHDVFAIGYTPSNQR